MLGSTYTDKTLSSSEWLGTERECELCQRVRRCTEHSGMLACFSCQSELLPRRRMA